MKNNLTQQTSLTDKGLIVSGRTTKLPGEGNQHDILTGSHDQRYGGWQHHLQRLDAAPRA